MIDPIDPYALGDEIEESVFRNVRRALRCELCGRVLSDLVRLVDHYDLSHNDDE